MHNSHAYDQPHRRQEEDIALLEELDDVYKIILHNDDINTFDYVIGCLIEICKHTLEQAEQCALLVHFKGKCSIKTGSLDLLKPMHLELLNKGLTTEII